MTVLVCPGVGTFPAFSGNGIGRNNAEATDRINVGALPEGRYYIVDRASGGILAHLRDLFLKGIYGTDRNAWFALYRDDGKVDDITFIHGVRRGNFRLHPIGPRGLSEGCITLLQAQDYRRLADYLHKRGANILVPGSGLRAYGTIEVRK